MSDEDTSGPIRAPDSDRKREGLRAIVEAAAQATPVTSALARIYQTTHPPLAERERETWQVAVTERTNENTQRLDQHHELLQPGKVKLLGVPAQLAQSLIRACPDGLGQTSYDLDGLCLLVPDASRAAVEEAAFELEQLEIVNLRRHLQGWHASLLPEAYEQLDTQIMGWDLQADASTIAQHMLEQETGHAPALHALTGWERRRFNPAFRVLLRLFPDGRVRKTLQADYPSMGVIMAPEDRVRLRRFIASQPEAEAE